MSEFASLIREAGVEELHRTVENGRDKYLAYTRLKESNLLILGVTDGCSVWKSELDNEEIETHRDLSGINTVNAMMTKIRNAFVSGELAVSLIGTKMTVSVGKGSTSISFDLYESKVAQKNVELTSVLFRLADVATTSSKKLAEAKKTIDSLHAQKNTGGANALLDIGPKRGANPAKNIQKKAGMSILNPTNRKRKAAKGVEFD